MLQCGKELKLKVRKIFGLILTFVEVAGEKLVGGRVNWYGERQILFKQEKVIEYLFCPNHDGIYKNTSVQRINPSVDHSKQQHLPFKEQ